MIKLNNEETWTKFRTSLIEYATLPELMPAVYVTGITRLTNYINGSGGFVNIELYLKSLAQFYGKVYNTTVFTTLKSLQIYKSYVTLKNADAEHGDREQLILSSIRYIRNYCIKKEITFSEYLFEGQYLTSTLFTDYVSGAISKHFLACVNNIGPIIKSLPTDCVVEFTGFLTEKDELRKSNMRVATIANMKNDINVVMELLIKSGRTTKQ